MIQWQEQKLLLNQQANQLFKMPAESNFGWHYTVYYLASSDYNKYMDTQQEINLTIKEKFEKERIEFAYPTQTIFVKKT